MAVAVVAVLAGGGDLAWVWAGCVLGWALLPLAVIDAQWLWLPDVLTLPLLLAGLAVTLWCAPGEAPAHAAAAAAAYLICRGLALAYRRWRGRDGLGAGDAKLLAAAGAWVGPWALGDVLLGAAALGLVLAMCLRLKGRTVTAGTALPFGPGLAAATWVVWLSGADGAGRFLS